VKFDGLPVIAG